MTSDGRVFAHPMGGLREFISLFFPILLMTFSTCLILFVEKLLLGRLSTQAMEVAVTAAYACQVFQAPCVALAMMAQVFVGRWHGAGQLKAIGAGVWQFIWFACLSLLVTVPLSLIYGRFYFQGTVIEEVGLPYFYCLVAISFLFPLGAALSCFYIGQGKTRLVLWTTLGSQIVKLITAGLFIFGWGWFPSFGLMGGVISTFIAQGGLCLFLLWIFLSPKQAAIYDSHAWRFQPKLFWDCIQPGLLRAMNRVLNFTSWAMIARMMTAKGGDHLLILSIGGTLFLFLPFLGDALLQAQTTVVSQILGAQKYPLLSKAFRSGSFLVLIIVFLVSIPLLLFPSVTFQWLFPGISLSDAVIQKVFLGVCLSFTFFVFGSLPISYILAFKDMKFSLFMGAFNWINGFLLMYLTIEIAKINADQFWTALSLMHLSTCLLYLLRMQWLKSHAQSDLLKKLIE